MAARSAMVSSCQRGADCRAATTPAQAHAQPSVRREDEFFVGNASVVYALDEVISFYAMYAHRENSSNRSGLGFNSNILSFGASLRY